MTIVRALCSNKVFARSAVSWAAAQIIKTMINLFVNRELSFERMFGSGGMPSSHSSFVTAMAVSTVLKCGLSSEISAIAICMAVVVMYDAMNVRQQAGEHAKFLNDLIECLQKDKIFNIDLTHNFKELLGHTPSQVVCGAILGLVIALIMR